MKNIKKLITTLLCLFILCTSQTVITTFATTREYYIDNLNINAEILENGDVEVNETLEYRFSGDFNGVFRNLDSNGANGYKITEVSVSDEAGNTIAVTEGYNEENNTYEINESGGETQIKIFTKSSYETKKINIKYTIEGAAKKYENYSELYWNFYTVNNIDSVKEGTLKVSLKNAKFNEGSFYYELFGDGEIDSTHTENEVMINFKNLTSLIGIKAQFQKDYLSMVEETPMYTEYEGESEEYFDNYYNGYDDGYDDGSSNSNEVILVILAFLIGGGGIGGFFIINDSKFKDELDNYRAGYSFSNNEFCMEPPSDLPPALVNLLINEKCVSENMLNPTLFYLANKGYYKLEPKNTVIAKKGKQNTTEDLVFIRVKKSNNLESKHLEYVIEWFGKYEKDGQFSLQDIKKLVSSQDKAKEFIENLSEWKSIVLEEAEYKGFYTQIRNKKVLENTWYDEKLKWLSYKEYLKKVAATGIEDVDASIGDNIIYAHALEITDKDFKNLIDFITAEANKNNYGNLNSNHYWLYYNNYFYYTILFNDINGDAHNIASPPDTSSFDFGGISGGSDFSGGGGGDSGAF